MTKPHFSDEEQYCINWAKTGQGFNIAFDLGYLIPSFVLAGCGIYWSEPFPLFAALGVIAVFKVWEWSYQYKWAPVWKSIIEKYEDAVAEPEKDYEGG